MSMFKRQQNNKIETAKNSTSTKIDMYPNKKDFELALKETPQQFEKWLQKEHNSEIGQSFQYLKTIIF